mmetsp:Transcript_2156/g.2059  ORF Transcript_2156/g.2059 Transcript_2156/m.2059 type:complete len:87 (+) Transcript_2156:487-747(+)
MQEVLTTNGRALVKNENSLEFMFDYLNETIQDQEEFLQLHSNNQQHHSQEFNDYFDSLIYDNVCSTIYAEASTQHSNCSSFMGGIL